MGIKFKCTSCDFQLNVKTKLAGMRGICPKCKAKIKIPQPPKDQASAEDQASEKDRSSAKDQASAKKQGSAKDQAGTKDQAKLAAKSKPAAAEKPSREQPVAAVPVVVENVKVESGEAKSNRPPKNKPGKPARIQPPAEGEGDIEIFQPSNSAASTASVSSVPGTGEPIRQNMQGEAPVVQAVPLSRLCQKILLAPTQSRIHFRKPPTRSGTFDHQAVGNLVLPVLT